MGAAYHLKKIPSTADSSFTMINTCKICKTEFKTRNRRKTCSPECLTKLYKVRENQPKPSSDKLHKSTFKPGNKKAPWLRLRFKVFLRDNFTCQYCGRTPQDGAKLQADHIFPKSKGGGFTFKNLITSCTECNQGKSDILLEQWQVKRLRQRENYA